MNDRPTRPPVNRREFLGNSARQAAGVAAGVMSLGMTSPHDRVRCAVVGLGKQGLQLAQSLAQLPGADVPVICDVDVRAIAQAQATLASLQPTPPVVVTEYERILDHPEVDAVIIATPDHWHASIAVEACQAGKDLYIEQPLGLTIDDGRAICSAAEANHRIVQTGLPQRSGPHFIDAMQVVQSGQLGRIPLAKAWAVQRRRSIGRCAPSTPPRGIDYDRWLGPAPERPFQANRFHDSWQWFWDYGSGELGQWGVQMLDVARWGLGVDLPQRTIATGSCTYFRDDRETPDTMSVQYEYPETSLVWEHRQWSQRGIEGRSQGVAFYGEKGTLIVDRSGWKVYDCDHKLGGPGEEIHAPHLVDFLDAVRSRRRPRADAITGHLSATLCHLGNLSWRLGREVRFDPAGADFGADHEANHLLSRAARTPWNRTEA